MIGTRLVQDLAYAARTYRRRRGAAAVAVATLALGMGANATVFGFVDRLLLRPPPYVRDPDRVVRFYTTAEDRFSGQRFATTMGDYAAFAAVRDGGRSFEGVAGTVSTRDVTLGRGADARLAKATLVTAGFFPVLGARPALGRFFAEDDDRASSPPVVVLSHELWAAHFGGDSTVLGRTVTVLGSAYTVVGVAPPGFTGVELWPTDLWLPLHVAAPEVIGGGVAGVGWQALGGYWMEFVARLRPGVTRDAASAEATLLVRGSRDPRATAGPPASVVVGPLLRGRGMDAPAAARLATWLAAMSFVVLLVACANVANLLLAHAVERRREIAIRLALGAGRGRIVRQLLAEGLALAVCGGAAALLVSYWSAGALRAVLTPDLLWPSAPTDARVAAATAVLALGTGVLTGLVPALRASRPHLTGALKQGERSSGSTAHSATRAALLVTQVALCATLLVGAGLLLRSLHHLAAADPGMDVERVLVASVDLPRSRYSRRQVAALFDEAAERVRALPGVERVSLAAGHPFGPGYGGRLAIPGRDSLPELPSGGPYEYDVAPGFFATLGTRLVRGRDFTAEDRAGAPPVLIVNETMARLYWPGADPVGRCARIAGRGDACVTVVGVVENVRRSQLREAPQLLFYTPLAQSGESWAGAARVLVVRPRGDPLAAARAVRAAVQSLAPDLPFVNVRTFAELAEPQVRPWRLATTLFSLFGALALAVAAVGLYGVISFGVMQRRGEFGIRMALGARGADVVRLVLREGLRHTAIGLALGLAIAFAAAPRLVSFLVDVSPHDGATFGGVALVLLVVSVAACVVPAWRATRADPVSALRAE